jgi:uncharacterized protein YjdB
MKKSKILVVGALAGLTIASLSAVIAINAKNSVEAKGYTAQSIASVTTIDLNDTSASSIRSYYSDLNNLSTSERQGTNLLKNLKPILKNNQKYYAYDGASLWAMYEITDRDWSKSPASAISGYNASTKKISNYSYGSSYSNPGMNPYIHELYINRNVDNQCKAWTKTGSEASHGGNKEWYIDQEHIWPKSQGFNESGAGGARGDPMHLWPGDSYVNSALHSNNFYGYVNTSSSYTDGKSKYSEVSGNYLGKSLNISGTDSVFEPQDSDKGDIARAIFYMVARYNYYSGSDSDGIDTNNPNLELVQSSTSLSSYTSSKTNKGKMGILTDLLEWNRIDPPDEFEIHRNNLLYTNYTNNRNPFIDFPEWAEFIWGDVTYNGRKLSSYSSTPTGYATPSSDSINTWNSGTVTPTLYLNKDTLSLTVDGTETLVATALNGSGSVTWSSDDTSVATVSSSGLVTAKAAGTATITASYSGVTATCTVTVTTSGGGGEQGDTVTISTMISDYATAHSWENGTKYASVSMDEAVTVTASNVGTYSSSYYTNGNDWRFYQTENPTITVSVPNGYVLDSVTFTYNSEKTGIILDADKNTVTSGTAVALSGTNAAFTIGNSDSSVTKGQARITAISVTYHATSSGASTVTGVTLDPTSLSLDLATTRTATIEATVTGTNNPSQNVLWESSDESVITVEDGDVTAKAVGSATITVTSVVDSTKSATCTVNVINSVTSEQTVTIKYNDTFTPTLPTAKTDVSTTAVSYTDSTSNFSFAASNLYKPGNYIMFYHNSDSDAFLYNTTSLGEISNITVHYSSGTGLSGKLGVYFGLEMLSTYQSSANNTTPTKSGSDSFANTIPNTGFFQISISDSNIQITEINITYSTSGSSKTLSSIAVSDPRVSFSVGQEFVFGGTVTATYSDYTTANVTLSTQFSGYDMDTVGVYTVTATYGGKTATYVISVNDVNTSSSSFVNGIPYKMFYYCTSKSKDIFFAGTMGTYYGQAAENMTSSVDVYFESNGDGQNIYMKDGSAKKYFYVADDGEHVNFKCDATKAPSTAWVYSQDYECLVYKIGSVYYTFGSYSDKGDFRAFNLTKYPDNYKVSYALSAEGFSQLFMDNITCDASGNTAPSFATDYGWNDFNLLYSSMKDEAKSVIQSAEANENGTTYLVKAMYRYDYIVGKYGTATYTDFIGRNPASIGRAPLTIFSEVNSTSMTAIIVLLTLAGVTSIGVIITLKKRKEN